MNNINTEPAKLVVYNRDGLIEQEHFGYVVRTNKDRVLETVNNDDCSFIYQFVKFYVKKEDDELINFKDTNMLKNMVDLGFDGNSVDNNGETILMYAIRNQMFEACFTILLFDEVKLKIKNKKLKIYNFQLLGKIQQ